MIVDSRCAITIDVRPLSAASSAGCTRDSFSESRWLVASSRITIAGFFESMPRDRDPLLLAAREPVAALADERVVAIGQRGDHVVDLRGAARSLELCLGGVGLRVAQVVGDDSWKRCGSCATTPIAARNESLRQLRTSCPSTRTAPPVTS